MRSFAFVGDFCNGGIGTHTHKPAMKALTPEMAVSASIRTWVIKGVAEVTVVAMAMIAGVVAGVVTGMAVVMAAVAEK